MIIDKFAAVSRLTADNDNANKKTYIAVAGLEAVPVNLQPASAEATAIANGVFGKTFVLFTETAGILDADRVTIEGTTYTVKGVEDWHFAPLPHYRMILFKAE